MLEDRRGSRVFERGDPAIYCPPRLVPSNGHRIAFDASASFRLSLCACMCVVAVMLCSGAGGCMCELGGAISRWPLPLALQLYMLRLSIVTISVAKRLRVVIFGPSLVVKKLLTAAVLASAAGLEGAVLHERRVSTE